MNHRIIALGLAAAITTPALALADTAAPRIVVAGQGESTVAPDLAILTLSVMREAPTAREALDANTKAMADVIAAMKEAGVADRDLQTAGIQIQPRYTYTNRSDGGQDAVLAAYQVSNTLTVRVRDLPRTGEILDRAVTLGVNQGGNVVFSNANPTEVVAKARTRAVEDAVAKAKTLAAAAGVELGRVLEISDQAGEPSPLPITAKAFDVEASPSPVPVEAGENSYRVQVTVTFELR